MESNVIVSATFTVLLRPVQDNRSCAITLGTDHIQSAISKKVERSNFAVKAIKTGQVSLDKLNPPRIILLIVF